ncbi:FPGS [Mytilus coruscus]|uniref:FPGS n=1 Tax=Mytilus coruscus TaxID=42192 RepID=A0A6J7ZW89_MYTCO|nr:FPGS [Mytilus coruscus]
MSSLVNTWVPFSRESTKKIDVNKKYEECVQTLNSLQSNEQTLEKIQQAREKHAPLYVSNIIKWASRKQNNDSMPAYFAFLTIVAYYTFLHEETDVAIIEVGIGGQYEYTNMVRKPVVCEVTSLGIDHVSNLGNTLEKIAWHKAGIFKCHLRVVPDFASYQRPAEKFKLDIAGHIGELNGVNADAVKGQVNIVVAKSFPLNQSVIDDVVNIQFLNILILSNLSVTDVEILDSYAILHLKTSKTDPFRKGVSIQLHKSDHTICPFSVVQKYIVIRKGREASFCFSDPLFVKEKGSALDRDFFIRSLRHVLDICGYNSSLYNGHSFRISASTSAGSVNIQDHLIKTLGRWTSDSYCRYIRISKDTIRKAQKSLTLSKNI